MIVIADMGSTKTDWSFADGSTVIKNIQTRGFNPYFYSGEDIEKILEEDFKGHDLSGVEELYFYGAGCSNEEKCKSVEDAIKKFFPDTIVEVEHDLLASARALCGKTPGIACILGTGSNTCMYDGTYVIANNPSLGFLLGDEGSGSHLGRELIKCYFYNELPQDISVKLERQFNISRDMLLDDIYAHPSPNSYLAAFAKFLIENKENAVIKQIIVDSFDEFFRRHIHKYDSYQKIPVNFIGSIAYYFKEVLQEVAKRHKATVGLVIKTPVAKLIEFHKNA